MIIDTLISTLATARKEEVKDYTIVVPLGRKPKRVNYKNEHFGTITHECNSKIVLETDDVEIMVQIER